MRALSFLRHRPSPAIAISAVALFMSLGGVGYAATQLPHNSVGAAQLRNGSVSYKKIVPGAVGIVRANTGQLQVRVSGTCPANNAISTIDRAGKVTCNSTVPAESGTTSNTASIPTTGAATSINTTQLGTGTNWLAMANPQVTTSPASGATSTTRVTVSCTLTVGSDTQTRSATITAPTAANGGSSSTTIPLQLAGTPGTSSVSCQSTVPTGTTAVPTVSITSALNAIQIAS